MIKTLLLLIFLLNISTLIGDDYYPARFEGICGEEYNLRRLEFIGKFLPENPTILEAGCFNGADTLNFLAKWPAAKIIAFEANPNAYKMASEATKSFSNVLINNVALNNYNGLAKFYLCHGSNGDEPAFEGASSLLKASDYMKIHYQGPEITVPCVILDDWCQKNNVKGFDFMWLDLEGAELRILSSSPQVLANTQLIYVETNFQHFREGMTQFQDLRSFLESQGFCLLSHWYRQNFQGDALFIRND